MFYSVYRRCFARESVISQEAVSPHSAEAMATVKLPRRDSEMLNSRREAFIASTLLRYFSATGTSPQDFDAIFTGDLGEVGTALLHEQMAKEGLPLDNHKDCGCLLYDTNSQNVQAGGSGAGCSAAVLCGKILPMLAAGQLRRVLFLATGALMSQTTFLQGESIPGIAHCVELGGAV